MLVGNSQEMDAKIKLSSCSNMMAQLLDKIAKKTDSLFEKNFTSEKVRKYYQNNEFNSIIKPDMTIREYLHRLAIYLHISEACFILALVYIDRLTEKHPRILVNSYSIHR